MTSYKAMATWKGEHWGHVSCSNGAELDFSAPPSLHGHPGVMTPEDGVVSALNMCFQLMFLWAAERFEMGLVPCECEAEGFSVPLRRMSFPHARTCCGRTHLERFGLLGNPTIQISIRMTRKRQNGSKRCSPCTRSSPKDRVGGDGEVSHPPRTTSHGDTPSRRTRISSSESWPRTSVSDVVAASSCHPRPS